MVVKTINSNGPDDFAFPDLKNSRVPFDDVVSKIHALGTDYLTGVVGNVTYWGVTLPIHFLATKDYNTSKPSMAVFGGVHGDEPAGTYSVLEYARQAAGDGLNYTFIPLINPSGFILGTRENALNVDINRDFDTCESMETRLVKGFLQERGKRFDLAFVLHEDNTDKPVEGFKVEDNPLGFYVYEYSPKGRMWGKQVVKAVEACGFPVCRGERVYEDTAEGGVIRMPHTQETLEREKGQLFIELLGHTNHVLVPETPTCHEMGYRVRTLVACMHAGKKLVSEGQ
ncbi:MAG: succinylglutamate desuccinylase/aspartoacylase family protein, partial [Candidatus Altiarchaeota archaeon]|nr:succinylglutamate desuccinylase/aspartoacylase family protein [Candidatus Altiarchaeota archaeon]